MSWNYRIKKTTCKTPLGEDYTWYALHECYYSKKGVCDGYTKDAVSTTADSAEMLVEILERQLADAKKLIVFTDQDYNKLTNI